MNPLPKGTRAITYLIPFCCFVSCLFLLAVYMNFCFARTENDWRRQLVLTDISADRRAIMCVCCAASSDKFIWQGGIRWSAGKQILFLHL